MAHPAFRWSRLLIITALLVITTGVAAAPFRDAWLPIVGRPLNLWNNGAIKMPPTAAPLLVSRDLVTPQAMVDAPFIVAPERLDYRVSGAGSSDSRRDDWNRAYSSWSSETASRRAGGRARASSGNGSGGASGGGSGRFANGSFARQSGSYNRNNSPTNEGSRSSGSSSSGSASNGGGSRGPSGGGTGGTGGADDLFTDHGKGLPDLSGNADGLFSEAGVGGDGARGPKLASSPEPSSILLFGTGIVAVAGALRRRMRH